jgi:hypothetical protein
MIPEKIQALLDFIDFLDENKNEYSEKYIPLCEELRELDERRNSLKPNNNYKDKQSYDLIQKEIKEKFAPISENIYKPITSKLQELGIWAGDEVYTSIWNNNISEISDFKRNFAEADTKEIFKYKQNYLDFRTETNNNFLYHSSIFSYIDEILKELFDFFKDTNKNEFENFEAKTIEVGSFTEITQNLKENLGINEKYSILTKTFFGEKHKIEPTKILDIKTELIFFNMGDKIEVGNITNNKGQVTIGKDNTTTINDTDEIAKNSFRWQKRETIISIIIGIIGIVVTYISMIK